MHLRRAFYEYVQAQQVKSIYRNTVDERRIAPKVGDSREIAVQWFRTLEHSLERKPNLKREYADFIHEYLKLGHMKRLVKSNPT